MKYVNGESEYYNFWQYIRALYGYKNTFKSREEFMKLGYDGIHSKKIINAYEPQIVIFELKNLTIVKKEETKDIFIFKEYYDRAYTEIKQLLKEYVPEDLKISFENTTEYEKRYNSKLYECNYICIKNPNNNKKFSIYIRGYDSRINVEINHPYTQSNRTMGATMDIYEPDWVDFINHIVMDLRKVIKDIQ